MNKKQFLDKIRFEDKILLSNIFDKIEIFNKINKPIYLNEFYPPAIWKALEKHSTELGCKIGTFGIFEECDRRSISMLPNEEDDDIYKYKINLIKIINKSAFSKLRHSDYLGTLMAQGIKREKFGDLLVDGESCYVPVCSDIVGFIKDNLKNIAKSPCFIEELNIEEANLPKVKYEIKTVIVSSLRLDCVVSALCGVSRNSSVDLIKKGMVLYDYEKASEKDEDVYFDTTITIRGYGKFKIEESIGKTQKDKERIIVKKYI
jgi:RNA-binding protein YlmH